MGFTGTQDKCKACGKTVYVCELLTADGVPYHKTCFKCTKCNGLLVMGKYSSMDGVLYCKPHFEQLFKETGRYSSNPSPSERSPALAKAPSKLSGMFSGTLDKCVKCKKTVYLLEKVSVEGEIYHKNCFRCHHGGCFLTPSSYAALDGILYCKPHFAQLFKRKGSYNHLTQTASASASASAPASPSASPSLNNTAEPDSPPDSSDVPQETEPDSAKSLDKEESEPDSAKSLDKEE